MKNLVKTVRANLIKTVVFSKTVLSNNRGSGALDIAITVLVSIVLGGLILGGLYLIINSTVLPSVTSKLKDMFNYAG
jgi:hypothetical protein